MRVFQNQTFHETFRGLLSELVRRPDYCVQPRGLQTSELQDVVVALPGKTDAGFVGGRTDAGYMLAETAWYLSRSRRADFIEAHAKMWGRVKNPDGTLNSNYGYALWANGKNGTEWGWAKKALLRDKDSRQAVATIHRPLHHWDGNKDLPCTLNVAWQVRDGLLQQRVHMRSSDAWYGLPYDVPWWLWVQRRMVWELREASLNVAPGPLVLWADSCHLYEDKLEKAHAYLKAWAPAAWQVNPVGVEGSLEALQHQAEDLLASEKGVEA